MVLAYLINFCLSFFFSLQYHQSVIDNTRKSVERELHSSFCLAPVSSPVLMNHTLSNSVLFHPHATSLSWPPYSYCLGH